MFTRSWSKNWCNSHMLPSNWPKAGWSASRNWSDFTKFLVTLLCIFDKGTERLQHDLCIVEISQRGNEASYRETYARGNIQQKCIDPRVPPVVITIFTHVVRTSFCPSVPPSLNCNIKQKSLPTETVGWPSGSLMTPIL